MASFACRICKEKFSTTRLLTDPNAASAGYSVVASACGHLFHLLCLEGALTNQKLLHMRHGTGPLRRFCPVGRCNADIKSDESIIPILLSDEENSSQEDQSDTDDGKLVKRIQTLMNEKEKLLESLQRSDNEVELLRSVLDEIKLDLSDVKSFMKDDLLMKKGDLVFWITKDGTYIPGKVLEIRKKPGEVNHYAIVKLEKKSKPNAGSSNTPNRDTLILPVSDLVTFKAFFCEFFEKFQIKFESLIMDLNWDIQELSSPTSSHSSADRSAAYYKSTRKLSKSNSKSSIGLNLDELDSSVSVDSIPVAKVRRNSQPVPSKSPVKVTRSRTIHYGEGNKPRRLEKCRSKSWANPPTRPLLDSPNESHEIELELASREEDEDATMSLVLSEISQVYLEEEEDDDMPKDFIKEGERVIWFDKYSEYEQIGTVAAVCEYSPCAIVHFDDHPYVKHKFQYRTVPLDELFPYDLASPEDKLRIAEIYGKMMEFVESHQHIFRIENNDGTNSASDCEEIIELNLDGKNDSSNA